MGLIFNSYTNLSSTVNPIVAFITIWAAVLWLTMIEGSQASLVGLSPIRSELYKDTHKKTAMVTAIVHTGDNLDRYLLGRQFMVVLIVFTINLSGAPLKGVELWGFPPFITNVFLNTGFAMILFTAMIGQLNSQVNASHCMLDYINNYFALFTIWVAMAIEFSGLLHASYVVHMIVSKLAGKPVESFEDPRTPQQEIFFWLRCLLSITILGFCVAVTVVALFDGQTTMWEGVPPAVAIIIFLVLMCVVGMLEAMQIAFFAVAKLAPSERGEAVFARKTCECLFKGHGRNLPGFMIGRQLSVVSCMFFIARVTTLNVGEDEENIFGVSDGVQAFLNTGLCGALVTTILGSIAWQLVAAAFPLAFLSNPLTYVFLRICLLLEATGICSGAWVLAGIHKRIAGFQRDEVYIGTAEERAAKNLGDDDEQLHLGPGHMLKLPGFAEDAPAALKELMESDPSVVDYVKSLHGIKAVGDVETAHGYQSECTEDAEHGA
jgi:silicon transporter